MTPSTVEDALLHERDGIHLIDVDHFFLLLTPQNLSFACCPTSN